MRAATRAARAARFFSLVIGLGLLSASPARALPDEILQEGLLLDAAGAPLDGPHDLRVRLYAGPVGGPALFDELHPRVEVFEGYYALRIGGVEALDPRLFTRETLYLGLSVDGAPELLPRIRLGKVPAAMAADVARTVTGDITPTSIRVGGQLIVDAQGRWVGPLDGLQGPAGPAGPAGPPGPAGGAGSPDTPQQILEKLRGVDGPGSGLDCDQLDGLDSAAFPRSPAELLERLRTVDGAGSGLDCDRIDGLDSTAFPRTPLEILERLRAADGAGSGLDADRLDGLDSAEFLRTPEQVLERLRTVDGEGSGLDADRLDGLDSRQLMRADADTGTTGDLDVDGILYAGQARLLGNGTLGVGVANPQARVDVDGEIRALGLRLTPQAEPPPNPTPGTLYFDAERATLRLWNGEVWLDWGAGGGGGAVVDPAVQRYVDAVLASGPTAYWKLDEAAGDQALDSSGSGHHGRYVGNVHRGAQGLMGPAVNIRSAGWVETPVNLGALMPADRGTVTALVRLPDEFTVFGNRPFQSTHHVWSSYAYWQGVSVGVVNGVAGVHFWGFYNGQNEYRVSVPAEPGQWVHLAWVHRGQRLYGYVNGVEVSVAAALPQGSMGVVHIGHFHQAQHGAVTQAPEYPERIQHVAVYPVGLSAAEIRAQAEATGLVGGADGSAREAAGLTCKAILDAHPDRAGRDGLYWINPYGGGPAGAVLTYCDMTIDGGGWTLVGYSARGSVGALCEPDGRRNLYPLSEGGGDWDANLRGGAASLPAVPIARRSRELLLARSDQDGYRGPIGGATVATKFAIPDPAQVNFLNPSPASNDDVGPCVPVTLTTLRGPNATGATRYTYAKALMVTWSDTYPTSVGVTAAADCQQNTTGPAFVTSYTGRGWPQRYCWGHDALGGAVTYWHRGWWDATAHDRTGAASVWLR